MRILQSKVLSYLVAALLAVRARTPGDDESSRRP